jgi:DNA polymerase III subunit epsilon
MREIVLDTETTGLEAEKGDRIVEIACVEIVNDAPTGKTYHVLINPERDVPEEAARVHGHTSESLKDKPLFAAIAPDFLAFIGDDRLVIHNAEFDVRFLNAELGRLGHGPLAKERVVDTLAIARKKHPGASNSLDALCDRYRIDRSRRVFHGALLDCELLVEVYIELSGGRQKSLSLAAPTRAMAGRAATERRAARPQPLAPRLTEADLAAHQKHLEKYGDAAYWRKYGYAKAEEGKA